MKRVLVDGKPIPLRRGKNYDWTLREGLRPTLQLWELPTKRVLELLDAKLGKEITLQLDGMKVERVFVLGNAPSGYTKTQLLILADVRWLLTKGWIVRSFNVPRLVGSTRLLTPSDGLEALAQIASDVRYSPASLVKRKTPFTARAVLDNVLKAATIAREGRAAIKYVVDKRRVVEGDDVVVQETYIDDSMPAGLARAMSSCFNASLCPDLAGTLHVVDTTPGAEDELVRSLMAPLKGHGQLIKSNRAAARASVWNVRFPREVEILTTGHLTMGRYEPSSRNVTTLPDLETTIPERQGTQGKLARGSIVPVEDAYAGWGKTKGTLGVHPHKALDDEEIREHVPSDILEWTYFETNDNVADREAWARRLPRVRADWRAFYQINPLFMQNVESMDATLCTIFDPVTGTRAKSPVFVNHTLVYSSSSILAGSSHDGDAKLVTDSWTVKLVAAGKPAPFEAVVVVARQGLWRPRYVADEGGMFEDAFPYALEQNGQYKTSGKDQRSLFLEECDAVPESSHRISAIFTMRPAAPNDERRLYTCRITLAEVMAGIRWISAGAKPTKCLAPEESLRARITAARFPHTDDEAEQADRLAMFAADEGDPSQPAPTMPKLAPANLDKEVKPLALAMATADLLSKLDCWEGDLSVPSMCSWLLPTGSVREITFRCSSHRSVTRVVAERPEITPDPMPFLRADVRKALMRQPIS